MLSFGNITIASTKNGEFDFKVGNGSYPLTREDAEELVDWFNNKLMRNKLRYYENTAQVQIGGHGLMPAPPNQVMQDLDNAVGQLAANAEF